VLNEIEAETVLENCRALISKSKPGFLRKSPSPISYRFCCILSLPVCSQKVRVTPARAGERPELSVALTAPRLRTLHRGSRFVLDRPSGFLSEDIGSALKGGAKVCQRQPVNEVLGPLVTQFALNLAREDATLLQRGFHGGLLNRV
jgi:hypothetical protein